MANQRLQTACRQRGPQHDGEIAKEAARRSIESLIHRRIDVRNPVLVESVLLDVLNDAHDGLPGRILSYPNPAAKGLAARPIAASGGLVDDGDRKLAVLVALTEEAATHQRSPYYLEVIGADENQPNVQVVFRFGGSVFNPQREVEWTARSGQIRNDSCQLDAGNRKGTSQKLPVECALHAGGKVAILVGTDGVGQIDVGGDNLGGIKPRIFLKQLFERTQQQAGSDQ